LKKNDNNDGISPCTDDEAAHDSRLASVANDQIMYQETMEMVDPGETYYDPEGGLLVTTLETAGHVK
jgi:hypothetical protein